MEADQLEVSDDSVSEPEVDTPSQSEPEKKKRKRNVDKVKKYQEIPRDEQGNLILPCSLGVVTLEALGTVVFDRPAYHTERYIYPVGYTASRQFMSTVDPNGTTKYTCSVLDGGDAPKFQIVAQDNPDQPVVATSATGAWTSIIRGTMDSSSCQSRS